jgi:hypothetical protein
MVACSRAEACAAEFDLLKEPAEAAGTVVAMPPPIPGTSRPVRR